MCQSSSELPFSWIPHYKLTNVVSTPKDAEFGDWTLSFHIVLLTQTTFKTRPDSRFSGRVELSKDFYYCTPFLSRCFRKVRFIRRISAMSNAIQTKDNEANHLIIYCLNCIRHGRDAAYEPGLTVPMQTDFGLLLHAAKKNAAGWNKSWLNLKSKSRKYVCDHRLCSRWPSCRVVI